MGVKFPKLFEPGFVGKMRIKNRLVKAGGQTGFADQDGYVTERQTIHYKELAMGNVGLIIVGCCCVDNKASKGLDLQLSASGDEYLPGLSRLATIIQENGAKAALQIEHAGRQVSLTTLPAKAPSRIPWEAMYAKGASPPQELTFEEILDIVEAFGDAALRAKKAGFDMVEVQGAHGYLVTGFLSPLTNRRTDWYGGSLKDRMRFLLEVVQNIRKKVGADYPLSVRLSGSEYQQGGIEIEEAIETAKALEKSGVDIIHVSGGTHETASYEVAPMYRPFALHVPLAKSIKKAVHIPVIASGSITSPQLAEQILQRGQADFISLNRPLWADPCFPKKTEEGRPEDIVPCIRCSECSLRYVIGGGEGRSCTMNVAFGSQEGLAIEPTVNARNIAVVGSGPGGMEAARVAALRGHHVTLYESRDHLGGRVSQTSEFISDLARLVDYFSTQLRKLRVKVILGNKATVQVIQQHGFDAVILATGARGFVPDVRGVDKNLVTSVDDIMKGEKLGQNVVIVGGGLRGCELALFLAVAGRLHELLRYRRMLPQGWVKGVTRLLLGKAKLPAPLRKKIRILEASEDVASGISGGAKQFIFEGFAKYGVEINLGLTLEEITERGVIAVDGHGRKYNFEADSIVFTGLVARKDLLEGLEKANVAVYSVGDCVEPRGIYEAIHEGHMAARHL